MRTQQGYHKSSHFNCAEFVDALILKNILSSILLGLLFTILISIGTTQAKQDALCEKFVRVHIIADSNDPYDQALKLGVRDEIFKHFEYDFSKFHSKEETLFYLNTHLSQIEEIANNYLSSMNYEKSAKAIITKGNFPQKNYEKFLLPKGKYDALKVVIGSGKGQNFFCVMFPPACVTSGITVETNVDDIVSEQEKKVLNGEITYKFKLLEIAKSLFQ